MPEFVCEIIAPPALPRWCQRWLCVLAAIWAGAAGAAPTHSTWSVQTWQTDEGLPNNNVVALAQTKDGYLWVATSGHFARFDGVRFEEFSPKSVLPGYTGRVGRVSAMLEDHNGNLWLAMVHGPIVCLTTNGPKVYTNGLPDLLVLGMAEDGEGSVWIAYHGNALCRIQDGLVTKFGNRDGLPARADCALAVDKGGHLWFAKDHALGMFRGGTFETLASIPGLATRLAKAADGGVWICSGNQLFKCHETGGLQSEGTFGPATGVEPEALLEDHSGGVWIGTAANGLFCFDGSGFEMVPASHRQILDLMEDREGNLWVATGGGGLDRVQPRAFTLEGAETGLPFETVQSTCQDTHGTIWAITQNGLLVCRTNGGWRTITIGTASADERAHAICVAADRNGSIWVGTQNHALYRLQDGVFTCWRGADGLKGDVTRSLLAGSKGDLWIGEEGPETGVQCLRDGQLKTFMVPTNMGTVRAMAEDVSGNIWVGSSKGVLLRIHDDAVTDEAVHLSGTYTSIRCLYGTPDGSLWIGYAGWGLARYRDGHYTRLSNRQGLDDDYISQIVADGQGWLWLGGDRGIFKVREQEVDLLAGGKLAQVRSIHYGRDEGLPSLQANYGNSPGAMRTHNGQLWIPMRPNLVVINPENLQNNLEPPAVILKRVDLDDKTMALYGGVTPVGSAIDLAKPVSGLKFPPGHRRLQFEFTALSFGAPENVHFQYQLEGFDYGWTEAGMQHSVNYSRLAAGDYRFRVRACNGDGVWNEAGTALAFTVTPFFWQTWWFRMALIIFIGLMAVLIVRYILMRRLRERLRKLEQESALEKERSRIAKDIHDDLGGSLTQIKLLFELTQMRRTQPDKVDTLGAEGLAATRRIIKSLDEIVWAVNPRNDSLPHLIEYLGQFAVEFLGRADIRCRVDLPPRPPEWDLSPEARHSLFLVVKETLNNIVRHAQATEVWLRIKVVDQFLHITIEDDGRGFAEAPVNGSADGLLNIRQRMQELGGQSRVESKAGSGTSVFLTFPRPNGK